MTKYKMLFKLVILFIVACLILIIGYLIYYRITAPYLSDQNITIYTGYTKTLKALGRVKEEKWYSLDESIATVENGKITALSPGNTEICLDTGEKILTCEISIKESLSPKYFEIARKQKEWVLAQQLQSGALVNRIEVDRQMSVNPYFACMSLINILETNPTTEDLKQIRAYIDWHFEHLNTKDYNGLEGTIYDYTVSFEKNMSNSDIEEISSAETKSISNESYDSTDSYAAVFLILLDKFYCITKDESIIEDNQDKVISVYNSMIATNVNGFSNTKPDYKVAYLMDNVEYREGLDSAKDIFIKVIANETLQKQICDLIEKFDDSFNETWWDGDHYRPYIFLDDLSLNIDFNWSTFYSDGVSQAHAIIYGVGTDDTKKELYNKFCSCFNWEELDFRTDELSFYWGELSYVAVLEGDYSAAVEYIENYQKEIKESKMSYPLICTDASWVARTSYFLGQYYQNIELSYAD